MENSNGEKSQNSAPGLGDAKAEIEEQASPTSVFVNSEPIREDQVQNAVKFLEHPKVRGSPVVSRRSFLERKGLTKEEIDEAFRRVPDSPHNAQNQDGQVNTIQPQVSVQSLQPVAPVAPTAGVVSRVGTVTRSGFHWSHAVLAVGLLAISGAGTALVIKNAIIPRLKSWVRKVVLEDVDLDKKINSKPSPAEEAAAAAKAAAAAASDVAKASQEMLYSKSEERRQFEECVNLLDAQLGQMKLMLNAIQKLEVVNTNGKIPIVNQEDHQITTTNSKQPYTNGKVDSDLHSVTPVEPSVAPHPKSYMEIMAMVQRGEKPSNIRDINDLPPNPNQQPSNPRLAPKAKPWEVGQPQSGSGLFSQTQANGEGLNSSVQNNGVTYQINGDTSLPWWQKKDVNNIAEIENYEFKAGSSVGLTAEKPVQRTWVPPQPPPVALPEAAEAIRRPKSSVQKEQFSDEPTRLDVTDELQKATKASELGGTITLINGNSGTSSNEIQEVSENSSEGP